MKKNSLLLFILIFSFSCKQEKVNQKKDKTLISNEASRYGMPKKMNNSQIRKLSDGPFIEFINDKINKNLGLFEFILWSDDKGNHLRKISIKKDGKDFQTIYTNKEIWEKEFKLVDWNFDGYKDISVIYNCGSGGCAYWIWNYSPSKNKFVYNKDLSDVLGLEKDSVNKFIVYHWRAGYNDENWDTMKYVNDKLFFVKGLYQQRWNDQKGRDWIKKTRSKIINNKKVYKVDSAIVN